MADIPTIFQDRIDKTLEFETPRLVSGHHNRSQRNIRKTRSGCKRYDEETRTRWIQITPQEMRIFLEKEAEWVGHRINQQGIRPLQDKLEAIMKIDIRKKNTKKS